MSKQCARPTEETINGLHVMLFCIKDEGHTGGCEYDRPNIQGLVR